MVFLVCQCIQLVEREKNAIDHMGQSKRIIFLQSAHTETDERVLFHQAQTLREAGHIVEIYGMDSFLNFVPKQADIYIVDTPKSLWKIRHTSAKIVYDITEWYPSKKNLRNIRLGKLFKALVLAIANLWAGWRTDAFIFGEEDKAKPFRVLYPRKNYINLPYYPDLAYIQPLPTNELTQVCRVLYAGALTKEKGWERVKSTMEHIAELLPKTQFQLDVITKDHLPKLKAYDNLHIRRLEFMPFGQFCKQIVKYDLFLDLRDIDWENTHCLPIKLFYYMACGRPSIYSNLIAIRKGVAEIDTCACLVKDVEQATQAMIQYIRNQSLYKEHCQAALEMAQKQYNWQSIKLSLSQLIDEL